MSDETTRRNFSPQFLRVLQTHFSEPIVEAFTRDDKAEILFNSSNDDAIRPTALAIDPECTKGIIGGDIFYRLDFVALIEFIADKARHQPVIGRTLDLF